VLLGSFYSQVHLPGPVEIIFDDTEELEAGDFLHFSPVNVYGGMTTPPSPLPEGHDHLLSLTDIERGVVDPACC